jgi:hypothetical protein
VTLVTLAPRHVGWSVDGTVVASARMERDGDDVRVVETEYTSIDDLRELFDAVAAAATTPRLIGSDPALGECGFSEGVRELAPVASPTRVFTLGELEAAIRDSWCAETSSDADGWTPENPAYQHCDVTARVVNDYLGGDVLVCGVIRDGVRIDRHAWNRLPSGLEIDLTRGQFIAGEQYEEPSVLREYIGETLPQRYELFAARVRERLNVAPA